eukprot:scaffold2088_cov399-Prasinococcus_capsulatus_cf.AAC.50
MLAAAAAAAEEDATARGGPAAAPVGAALLFASMRLMTMVGPSRSRCDVVEAVMGPTLQAVRALPMLTASEVGL